MSQPPSPRQPAALRRAWPPIAAGAVLAAGLIAAALLDRPVFRAFHTTGARLDAPLWAALDVLGLPTFREPVVTHIFNAFGIYGLWLLVAIGYLVRDGVRYRWSNGRLVLLRAGAILLPALAAGLAGEALKVVIRRERPLEHAEYRFRPWGQDWFATSGLGLPSTHAAVAAAGAAALTRLHPRRRALWAAAALGCLVTRLQVDETGEIAHFLSDVYVGALLGWGAERFLNRRIRRQ